MSTKSWIKLGNRRLDPRRILQYEITDRSLAIDYFNGIGSSPVYIYHEYKANAAKLDKFFKVSNE